MAFRTLTHRPAESTFAAVARAVRQRRAGQGHVAVAVKVHDQDQDQVNEDAGFGRNRLVHDRFSFLPAEIPTP
jgi:hypothetical protein